MDAQIGCKTCLGQKKKKKGRYTAISSAASFCWARYSGSEKKKVSRFFFFLRIT